MPRCYKRKTDRANISEQRLKNAAQLVAEGVSTRSAAKTCNVNRMTLARYIHNNQQKGYEKTAAVHRVFTDDEEIALTDHIKALDDCFHGLSKDKCRKLAFDYAVANQIKVPPNWTSEELAGKLSIFGIL